MYGVGVGNKNQRAVKMKGNIISTIATVVIFLPLILTGRPTPNEVVAPITGAYKFLQTDDWFQVICASGNIEVANVGGYALVKCVEK